MTAHDNDALPWERLIEAARQAYQRAYAPYSGRRVGAALLGASGAIHSGCNVENASYGLTVCAERSAVSRAVGEGEREFKAIVVANDGGDIMMPCGACRQVLLEFTPDIQVCCVDRDGRTVRARLGELLPEPFPSRR
ncbi:cytidine deaminase [candidate division KD3-62 bacterium DG_56]|uniref:Cytidine deaminase n=1 Tax=candidate division KD3-62 bacterium DG_56 TaxID=1704032 RepID=A0A0S7XRH0_9BACT|nr:MAG: cytidine deaminase [candidate division KD3-62 bacterium DG_56]